MNGTYICTQNSWPWSNFSDDVIIIAGSVAVINGAAADAEERRGRGALAREIKTSGFSVAWDDGSWPVY